MVLSNIEIFLKKKKKHQCGRERYRNFIKDEKQKLVEYRKKLFQNAKRNKDRLIPLLMITNCWKIFEFLFFIQNFLFHWLIHMTKKIFFINLSQITP